MTIAFKRSLIWIVATLVAILLSLNFLPSARSSEGYVPVGNDSFYHARRILDTVADPSGYYEFDAKIHVPEGSLLTWPWAYDLGVAYLIRGAQLLGAGNDAVKIMDFIPPAALTIAMALVIAICVQLGLSLWSTSIAALAIALTPLTQFLFGIGIIDHHFAEYLFVLAALLTGLRWFDESDSLRRAIWAGAVLGIAPAFQNGLFILQIPLLTCAGYLWFRNRQLPIRSVAAFAAALVLATVLALLPSQPFRQLEFAYYYFSWFHLEIAVSTALAMFLMARLSFNLRSVVIIGVVCLLLLFPLVGQIQISRNYFGSDVEAAYGIGEVRSPFSFLAINGVMTVVGYYSGLVLMAPLVLIGSVVYLLKAERSMRTVFLCVATVLGLTLLMLKFRFHVFGSFGLIFPVLIFAEYCSTIYPKYRYSLMAAVAIVFVVAIAPARQRQSMAKQWLANDVYYQLNSEIFPILAKTCASKRGVVLANNDDGHYVRYHSGCSVIANNFMLTSQHVDKLVEMERLYHMSAAEFLQSEHSIRYVFARLNGMVLVSGFASKEQAMSANWPLVNELIFTPMEKIDPRFKLLKELSWSAGADGYTYARLFEIVEKPIASRK